MDVQLVWGWGGEGKTGARIGNWLSIGSGNGVGKPKVRGKRRRPDVLLPKETQPLSPAGPWSFRGSSWAGLYSGISGLLRPHPTPPARQMVPTSGRRLLIPGPGGMGMLKACEGWREAWMPGACGYENSWWLCPESLLGTSILEGWWS